MILDYIFFKEGGNAMKNLKKLCVLSAGILSLGITACGGSKFQFVRDNEDGIYYQTLNDFDSYYATAAGIVDDDERMVVSARAEAMLLDSGAILPTTTKGGAYQISRIAPHTVAYAMWGNDPERLKNMVIVDKDSGDKNFIKASDRAALVTSWKAALAAGDSSLYQPAEFLTGQGYRLVKDYKSSFQTFPETLDIQNTYMASDTESLVNGIEGLMEYDNVGNLQPSVAESYERKTVESKDGNYDVYTFKLKQGRKWYQADGKVYAKKPNVTAQDFVDAVHHLLDCQGGLEYLTYGVIENAQEYAAKKIKDFSKVGIKAVDDYTLEFKLCKVESFFVSRLSYSCFMPMNGTFFKEKGGAFGVDEYAAAIKKDAYKYGIIDNRNNMVYNGPYTPSVLTEGEKVEYVKNANYVDAAKVRLDKLTWIYDAGESPTAYYDSAVAGDIAAVGLGDASGLLKKAKDDGNFTKYAYVTDTDATTYVAGFNLNRGTFETNSVKSTQSVEQRFYTHRAMLNKNFRNALQHAWDRAKWNAVAVGEECKNYSLRNTWVPPEFDKLSKDTTSDYKEANGKFKVFAKNTTYGEMVEYFLKKEHGRKVETEDGQDGWYNKEEAQAFLADALDELGETVELPIVLDVTYYGASTSNTATARAFKESIEDSLGKENVEVRLNAAATSTDYYACGYRARTGLAGNFDIFYGSGWGPDYRDPSTYLNTMRGYGNGEMCKIFGLY